MSFCRISRTLEEQARIWRRISASSGLAASAISSSERMAPLIFPPENGSAPGRRRDGRCRFWRCPPRRRIPWRPGRSAGARRCPAVPWCSAPLPYRPAGGTLPQGGRRTVRGSPVGQSSPARRRSPPGGGAHRRPRSAGAGRGSDPSPPPSGPARPTAPAPWAVPESGWIFQTDRSCSYLFAGFAFH